MRSVQEKLTFWRLVVSVIFVATMAIGVWSITNLETVNYYIQKITLKIRGENFYNSGNSLAGISKHSRSTLKSFVNANSTIAAAQIINIDFKRNVRYTTYFVSNNRQFITEFSDRQNAKIEDTPLFTNDAFQNERIVKIINNNFICEPYENTLSGKLYPNAAKQIKQVCTISIPPFLGHFIGYINLHLYEYLTREQEENLRMTAITIATSIYENDVLLKKNGP